MKDKPIEMVGVIIETINSTNFKVKLEGVDRVITAYTSGRMYKNTIVVLTGDRVTVEISRYDLTKGRIKFRHKNK